MKAITIIKKIKKSKTIGNYIFIEIFKCFTCLFNDGFSQVMYIASFNFNLYEEVAESMISKHSALQILYIFY